MNRQWTYYEVTASVEQYIAHLVAQASTDQYGALEISARNSLLHHWAYGAYLLWKHLTIGYQAEEDDQRIRQIVQNLQPHPLKEVDRTGQFDS